MGIFDMFKNEQREDLAATKSALEAAKDSELDNSSLSRMVQAVLNTGLDGTGPIASATQVADKAKAESGGVESAIDAVIRSHTVIGGVGGFVTGLGGFITMPVALPANVLEFYITATRMVGAVAHLRGYDVSDPQIRTAILLTLIGSKAEEVLTKSGVSVGSGRALAFATKQLPPAALLMVNKAVAFRLVRGLGEKLLSRLGRGVPVVGGAVGGGIDVMMMRKIADTARKEFPTQV